MYVVRIEKWAENMEQATIGRWLAADGAEVAVQGPLAEIITDKADFILEAEADGRLSILAPEKSTLPIGYAVAAIDADAARLAEIAAENEALLESVRRSICLPPPPVEAVRRQAPERSARVRATPAARRLAREAGLDLAGFGSTRIITEADVADALSQRDAYGD